MKITNHIELSGPLSRNRSLRELTKGDLINVRILSRIDNRTAGLDLLGNRVRAHFQNDIPDTTALKLRITGNSRGMLVFSLEGANQDIISSEHNFLSIPGMTRYLSSLNGTIPDIFSLIKNFIFRTRPGKYGGDIHFLEQLLQKYTPAQVSLLSRFVSSGRGSDPFVMLVHDLLQRKQRSLEHENIARELSHILDQFTEDEVRQLAFLAGDPNYSQLVIDAEEKPVIVEILEYMETVAVRFSLTSAGDIQIVGRKKGNAIEIDIYMENKYFCSQFERESEKLDRRLSGLSGNISVRTFNLAEVHTELNRYIFRSGQKDMIDFTV